MKEIIKFPFVYLGFFLLAMIMDSSGDGDTDILQEYTVQQNVFTANIYKEIAKANDKKNFIVSPLSLSIVMALTQSGGSGPTVAEIRQALHLPDTQEKIETAFSQVQKNLQSTEDYNLTSANKIYVKETFQIAPKFQQIATKVFGADIEAVNFAQPEETAQKINEWVEKKTNNKIQNLISPDSLTELTRMVLVNALHFIGSWVNTFEKYATEDKAFYTSKDDNSVKQVPTMQTVDSFNYHESKKFDAKFLEMPYVGGDIVMGVILPNKRDGIDALEAKINEVFTYKPDFTVASVNVSLPKFKIETTTDMGELLKTLGVTTAFSTNADFSGMIAPDATVQEELYISDVIQKAFISVNEDGTEAAAATAVLISKRTMVLVAFRNVAYDFIVDHAFVYYIKHKTGSPLFIGRVLLPNY